MSQGTKMLSNTEISKRIFENKNEILSGVRELNKIQSRLNTLISTIKTITEKVLSENVFMSEFKNEGRVLDVRKTDDIKSDQWLIFQKLQYKALVESGFEDNGVNFRYEKDLEQQVFLKEQSLLKLVAPLIGLKFEDFADVVYKDKLINICKGL